MKTQNNLVIEDIIKAYIEDLKRQLKYSENSVDISGSSVHFREPGEIDDRYVAMTLHSVIQDIVHRLCALEKARK